MEQEKVKYLINIINDMEIYEEEGSMSYKTYYLLPQSLVLMQFVK